MAWALAMLPTFVLVALLSAAEFLVRPGRADAWRNLQAWGLNAAVGLALVPLLSPHLPSLLDGRVMPFALGAVAYLVLRDFLEFAYHRAQHAVPLLWSMHALHHSDPNMSALTTTRHFWGDQVIKALTIWPLAALVLKPTLPMVGLFNLVSLWNFVVHARLPIGFGPCSWLLNSPAYHRRHHSSLPEHYNSNYAALLPIFDVLCGTYNRPRDFPPTGLATRPTSLADLLLWPARQDLAPVETAEPRAI